MKLKKLSDIPFEKLADYVDGHYRELDKAAKESADMDVDNPVDLLCDELNRRFRLDRFGSEVLNTVENDMLMVGADTWDICDRAYYYGQLFDDIEKHSTAR